MEKEEKKWRIEFTHFFSAFIACCETTAVMVMNMMTMILCIQSQRWLIIPSDMTKKATNLKVFNLYICSQMWMCKRFYLDVEQSCLFGYQFYSISYQHHYFSLSTCDARAIYSLWFHITMMMPKLHYCCLIFFLPSIRLFFFLLCVDFDFNGNKKTHMQQQ